MTREFSAIESCNVKCRSEKRKRSTPWIANLCGLTKEHEGRSTAWNNGIVAGVGSI